MADTTTTKFGLTKPEVGASSSTWGGKLNTDLDVVDAALFFRTQDAGAIKNAGLSFAVAANALTATVRQSDGSTAPDSTYFAAVMMRSATASSTAQLLRGISTGITLAVASGATLGHSNGVAADLYWYLIDNAGSIELAVSSKDFGENGIVTTTAMSGSATSATTMYSTSARTSVAFIRFAKTTDTQTTAGTWTATPSAAEIKPRFSISQLMIDLATGIAGLTAKTTPIDNDGVMGVDSAASNAPKFMSFTNMWTNYYKAKADALYQPLDADLTEIAALSNVSGDILYTNATPAWARLAKGSNGQFLTLSSGFPAWADLPASGGMTFLGSITTTSGSSQSLSSLTLTNYKFLIVVFDGISTNNGGSIMSLNSLSMTTSTLGNTSLSWRGGVWVDLNNGIAFGTFLPGTISAAAGDTGLSNASTSVTLSITPGTFDAGGARVYGAM